MVHHGAQNHSTTGEPARVDTFNFVPVSVDAVNDNAFDPG